MVAVTVAQCLLSLFFDELITFSYFLEEFVLCHDSGVLAVLIILTVFAGADLFEAIPRAGVLGEDALDQLAERLRIRLIFEYFSELLLHRADQPPVERVGGGCLPERRTKQPCHEYSCTD